MTHEVTENAEAFPPQPDLAMLVTNTTAFEVEDEAPESYSELILRWLSPCHLQSLPHCSVQVDPLPGACTGRLQRGA
ncbi:hypothetical protein BRADO4589 [Bradyrhizobium sp. ORS 278]|nr:hypothetical protein BRADO4589 [Bradyrhizobium sp. ORS 278]